MNVLGAYCILWSASNRSRLHTSMHAVWNRPLKNHLLTTTLETHADHNL